MFWQSKPVIVYHVWKGLLFITELFGQFNSHLKTLFGMAKALNYLKSSSPSNQRKILTWTMSDTKPVNQSEHDWIWTGQFHTLLSKFPRWRPCRLALLSPASSSYRPSSPSIYHLPTGSPAPVACLHVLTRMTDINHAIVFALSPMVSLS